jgi:hypothetical protein
MQGDERITHLLQAALDSGDIQPPEERVAAFRAHVLAARTRKRPKAWRRVAIGFAVIAALAGGLVVGHDLPRPLRTGARAIGLDFVESPELVDARKELHKLGQALAEKNWSKVIQADRAMLGLVKKLDPEEQAKIVPEAHEIHLHAIEVLRAVNICPKVGPCPPP